MSKFRCDVRREGETLFLELRGVMDEESRIALPDLAGIREFRVDFDGITGINSCGVRDWVLFLQKLPKGELAIIYKNCHPSIVEQINMASSLLTKSTTVESFYAGYYCPACDHEKEVLFQSAELDPAKIPALSCEKCGESMEFEGDDDLYFRFLQGA